MYSMGDLFCGAGGLTLGAYQTGKIKPLWGVEKDRDAVDTMLHNHTGVGVFWDDVRYSSALELENSVDILAAGFPCNDFSKAGKQTGATSAQGSLYKEVVNTAKRLTPKVILLENVPALFTLKYSELVEDMIRSFNNAGYAVLWSDFINCADYGVPQFRHRGFVVLVPFGSKSIFYPPEPTTPVDRVTPRMAFEKTAWSTFNSEPWPIKGNTVERLKHIRPGKNVWDSEVPQQYKPATKLQLGCMYRRLDADVPSHTVLANGGGGTLGYHWEENRPLTNRERATLQGFPGSYHFVGDRRSVRRQIGNAVPPPVAKAIFLSIVDYLGRI